MTKISNLIFDSKLLEFALAYAKKGWSVLPLHSTADGQCSCCKQNCSAPAKHPLINDWLNEATTDPEKIRDWWIRWPLANVGILTGKQSGFLVIDVDPRSGGDNTLFDLEQKHGKFSQTIASLTGGGGGHFLFKHPGGYVKSIAGALGPGLDIKADGGYIVAPPSLHISGRKYEWEVSSNPDETELAELPKWLLEKLLEKNINYSSNQNSWIFETLENISDGNRHKSFLKIIGKLHRENWTPKDIFSLLSPHAEVLNFSSQLKNEIEDVCKRYPNKFFSPNVKSTQKDWPILAEEAFYGLSGEMIRAVEAHTEADPVALLSNFLTVIGNAIGPNPYFLVGATKHYSRLFICHVGETSKGRKGTGWDVIKSIIYEADSEWANNRIANGGLSSGEGLISQVRDERWIRKAKHRRGDVEEETILDDEGVKDKRFLVIEEELASAFKVMSRDGNTLSTIIRSAWDKGDLRTLIKNNPIKASGAHISIIGHITKQELLRYITDTEKVNGFANRFIWLLVKRSKLLSNPTPISQDIISELSHKISKVLNIGRKLSILTRDEEANYVWAKIYPQLSAGRVGIIGSILGRGEAQVTRLAESYALLDSSFTITIQHLKAALALWDYSVQSVEYIFGDSLGHSDSDKILDALQLKGELSDSEIYDLFQRHRLKSKITTTLQFLEGLSLIEWRSENTNGRPKRIWRIKKCEKSEKSSEEKFCDTSFVKFREESYLNLAKAAAREFAQKVNLHCEAERLAIQQEDDFVLNEGVSNASF